MSNLLADLTWPEVGPRPTVLVPVGSIEQHGPHLPFDTDTTIAVAVASSVAEALPYDVIVAPALTYGSSGEHQSFAGTSSIGSEVLKAVVVELVRSMNSWAGRIIFINAHGGNVSALSMAIFQMASEGHDVGWLPCATEDVDLHAGITETSLMLHLRPASVRLERAEPGDLRPLAEIMPLLKAGGVGSVSPNGVLGDPTGATANDGRRLFEQMCADAIRRIEHGVTDVRGMLSISSMGAVS